ncbi:hypothetical protein GN156_09125 [bacterium LRH843]|nr:hypothetical protein [bacterium LRH843]
MIENFEIKKKIFDRLPHGFTHFELILEGKEYEGQYSRSSGQISWLHPQPGPDSHSMTIDEIETEVHRIIAQDYLIENFEIKKKIFDHLPHGFTHFEMDLEGKEYKGQYRNNTGQINWLHPQPSLDGHSMTIDEIETEVHRKMTDQ